MIHQVKKNYIQNLGYSCGLGKEQCHGSFACLRALGSLSLQHLCVWPRGMYQVYHRIICKSADSRYPRLKNASSVTTWSCQCFEVGYLAQNMFFPSLLNYFALKRFGPLCNKNCFFILSFYISYYLSLQGDCINYQACKNSTCPAKTAITGTHFLEIR